MALNTDSKQVQCHFSSSKQPESQIIILPIHKMEGDRVLSMNIAKCPGLHGIYKLSVFFWCGPGKVFLAPIKTACLWPWRNSCTCLRWGRRLWHSTLCWILVRKLLILIDYLIFHFVELNFHFSNSTFRWQNFTEKWKENVFSVVMFSIRTYLAVGSASSPSSNLSNNV
jgi:hypothetical protein